MRKTKLENDNLNNFYTLRTINTFAERKKNNIVSENLI